MVASLKKTVSKWSSVTSSFFETVRDELGFADQDQSPIIDALFEAYSLAHYLPDEVYDVENDIYPYQQASHMMFECSTLIGASEETVNLLTSILTDILPPESILHTLFWASPKIGPMIDEMERQRSQGSEVLNELAKRRAQFYREGVYGSLTRESHFMLRDFRLFLCVSVPRKSLDEDRTLLTVLREDITNNLRSANIACMHLTVDTILSLKREWLYPSQSLYSEELRYDSNTELRFQITDIEARMRVKVNHIEIEREDGVGAIKCLSVRQYPKAPMQWQMGDLFGKMFNTALQITCPFLFSFAVKIKDKEKVMALLDAKYADEGQNAKQPFIAKWVKNFNKKYAEIEELRERLSSDDSLVDSFYNVILFTTPEQLRRDVRRAQDVFRANQFDLRSPLGLQLQTLLASLPFAPAEGLFDDYKAFGRVRALTSFNTVNLLPIQGEWKGIGRFAQIYPQRRGQFSSIYFFDNVVRNFNVAIIAPPGKGKSFLMNDYIQSMLSQGGFVYIIDVGGSYAKSCEILDGQLIDFNHERALSLNLFSTIDAASKNDSAFKEVHNQLIQLVGMMARPSGLISDEERHHIEKAIELMWRRHQNATTITLIAHYLESHQDPIAQNLGRLLYSYTKDGRYGTYFEPPCTLNFHKNLVILELGGLDGNRELQRIVLKILMYQIINVMYYKPLHIPKTCLIDEAYDLLADDGKGGNANFANEGYRRAPKYGGNFITITHGLDDYENNSTAKMCYDNAYYKIFLGASKSTIDVLKKSNQLDAYGERLLRSLKITKEYSEFLLMCEEQLTVHRLIVDPFSRVLNTTRGTEVEAIKRLRTQGYSLIEAINHVAKEVYGEHI
ncbi:type IV secretion system protein TraC [Legionella longbeachae]|uniref:type IV secretion system protein TraC n=1 Tax=Legionella longbeachae TaxID=450 RepID=UPI0009B78706|nr:type IV secretion system protein TraC [Legionella longbeachae]VEE02705.1 protein TraC [Legionella oakridgensis]ARB91032.1 type IV secretion system protein TraC [Legionella longbeachae]ARM32541.1 type IV secretion system protein TraC [Legionella longbeachae]RZV21177.1 type IV secretion system protein TraC [Legionella longbeachae]UAK45768.1 type IV secretion system protein TraC [Legionella longbeachae]